MTDPTPPTTKLTPADPFADVLNGLDWCWPDEPIRVTRTRPSAQRESTLGETVVPLDPPAFAIQPR